jgi:hypothetical protein
MYPDRQILVNTFFKFSLKFGLDLTDTPRPSRFPDPNPQ